MTARICRFRAVNNLKDEHPWKLIISDVFIPFTMHEVRKMSYLLRSICAVLLLSLVATAVQAKPAPKTTNPIAIMTVEGRGKVYIALYPKDAPKTVAHFIELCHKKFYDGILFHRVISDFVVQAGDPATKGMTPKQFLEMTPEQRDMRHIGAGGSGKNIPFERNNLTNDTGTIAMALSAPQSDTGDSQWFINLVPNHRLDGDYCVFGKVIKGMDVVKKIHLGDRIKSIIIKK